MSTIDTYNAGINLTSGTAYKDLPSGWYRIVAVTSDVTVTTSNDDVTYYSLGTVVVDSPRDLYISQDIFLKCTFANNCFLQRLQGMS